MYSKALHLNIAVLLLIKKLFTTAILDTRKNVMIKGSDSERKNRRNYSKRIIFGRAFALSLSAMDATEHNKPLCANIRIVCKCVAAIGPRFIECTQTHAPAKQ